MLFALAPSLSAASATSPTHSFHHKFPLLGPFARAQPFLCERKSNEFPLPSSCDAVDPIKLMTTLDGPFGVPEFPLAARAIGLPAEMAFGARATLAQLPITSGWMGSCVSLGTAFLLVIPLLYLRMGGLIQLLLTPVVRVLSFGLVLVDDIALMLLTALISIGATIGAALMGIGGGGSGAALLEVGPRLVASISYGLRARPGLRMLVGAFLALCWSPLKEELIFRNGLQRGFALLFQSRADSLAPAEAPAEEPDGAIADGAATATASADAAAGADWRSRTSASAKRRARLVSSILFALAHLPSSSDPRRAAALTVALPRAVAAGFSSYLCLGLLYERRGLPAAIGAHASHNLIVSSLHRMQGAGGWLSRTGLGFAAPLVPAGIYANAFVRQRKRSQNRATDQKKGRNDE